MKYLDPDREPNRWLEAILCQLIDHIGGDHLREAIASDLQCRVCQVYALLIV